MDCDQRYKSAIDTILGLMRAGKVKYIDKEQLTVLQPLYEEVLEGMRVAAGLFADKKVRMSIKNGRHMRMPNRSRYMPDEIADFITAKMISQVSYTATVGGRRLTIRFGIFSNSFEMTELEYCAQMIMSWVHTAVKYSDSRCGRVQTVDIYLTDYEKRFPRSSVVTLGTIHCNSAYSSVCAERNEIVVYRSEEWFKVFVHETFHSFGLEPSAGCESQLSAYVGGLLPIKPQVRVSEAYVETWARIVNVVYAAIINGNGRDEFYTILRFSLQLEALFSVYQAVLVLSFMNLGYESVTDKTSVAATMMYKENTHVFAYYVLTAAFMNDALGFVRWCSKHNTQWLQFYKSNRVCRSFERFIHERLYDGSMKKVSDLFKDQEWMHQGLRFTIVNSVI